MTSEPAPQPARHHEAMPGEALFPAFALWQESFALGTMWWNAMMGAYWPAYHPFHHRQGHHDPHRQLVVPDPIEEEGERALLA